MKRRIIISLFLTALALRIFLIPNRGFEADVAFWKSWGLSALDNGVVLGIGVTNNNYPTPFSYMMGLWAFLYRLFADPHLFDVYWNSGNVLFLLISKLPSILADLGIAGLILWVGKHAKRIGFPPLPSTFYLLLSVFYLYNPVSLIDGAWWGQVDSLGVFVFLGAVLLAVSDKPVLAGAVFMVSMMTKLQNMIYGPLFFLFLWQLGSFRGLIKGLVGAVSAFFFLNFEFLLQKNMSAVMESLTSNYDYFPLMSLNAFNLWWIVAGGAGMQMSDKFLTVGIINAKTTGLLLFSSGYLLAVITMLKETVKEMWKPSAVSRQIK
jgi:Gpi18-like mannosyltransferase